MPLRPGWVLERYWGWSLLEEDACLKLLSKKRGPITTFLLLALRASEERLDQVARRHGLVGPLSITVFNDFSCTTDETVRRIARRPFKRVTQGRWFGVGTYVFDLSEGVDVLWGRMAPRERTKCRKAESQGVRVEWSQQPSSSSLDAFLRIYGRMAGQKGLDRPESEMLLRMAEHGELAMARCREGHERDLVINLIYLQGGQAYFLFGARSERAAGGAGHLAQWETVRQLKTAGCSFYDLGLVASRDPSDGLHRFKRSLGGSFVDFGAEFQRVPRGLAVAYRAFRAARRGLRSA